MTENRIFSFAPLIDRESRLLVLGTMPSVRSLEQGFYYAHPRNAFWPLLAGAFGEPLPHTIEEKRLLALRHGVALWDVAHSCRREGSLDAAMREVAPNDFSALFAHYPGVRAVLLNGGTAWRLFTRLCDAQGRLLLRLPSTSPAYTLPYAQKQAAWTQALTGGAL